MFIDKHEQVETSTINRMGCPVLDLLRMTFLNQSGACRNTTMFTISLTHVIFIDKMHTK